MNKVLILKLDSENLYFFKIKEKYNICNYYKNSCSISLLYLLRILEILHISIAPFLGNWKKTIKKVNTVIIFPTNYNYGIARYIKKKNRDCKIICCFLDVIFASNKNVLKDKNIDEFWTFDKENAKEYNMQYFHQFYSKEIKLPTNAFVYDTIFLGREKGRNVEIKEIEKILKANHLKPYIKIITDEKDYIPYEEYLKQVSKSKTLLDILEKNQSGMTLRCMESIFFEKKLITNDKNVKNYDFYNKNNIFIIGEDDPKNLVSFINGKYEKIEKDIIHNYDIETWIKKLVGKM